MDVSSSSSSSNINDVDNQEETAQQWIYRHLIEFTNCEDSSAKNLVDGDCSPLIQLLTDMTSTLFITITKPAVHDLSTLVEIQLPPPKLESIKKKSKKTVKIQKSRIKETNKKLSKQLLKKKQRKKEKVTPVVVESITSTVVATVDMIFEWWTTFDFPPHEQFIFIVPNSFRQNFDIQLDKLYHLGFIKNRAFLKVAFSCVDTIFFEKSSFAMKLDLLLLMYEMDDRKMPEDAVFERFIIENVSRNFHPNGRIQNIDSEARSMALILSQTIQSFCFLPDVKERSRLLMQLSFYDIEYLGSYSDITEAAIRFERALKSLSFLQFLFKNAISEWTKKTYLYILDLFSTILAHEITRKSNFMTNYCPEMKMKAICKSFQGVVQNLVAVSREVFETPEDWSATNKVSFSFYIVGILEEEIDSIIAKVIEINSETRDMSLDRSAIQATKIILDELGVYLQEKCLESAVESGNLESLRSLAGTIVKHNKRLERVVSLY